MQITIETKELSQSQMELLMQIINPFHTLIPTQQDEPLDSVKEQPTEQANDKPKRTRRTKAEIEAENAQNTQEVSEPTPDEEKAVEVPQNDSDSTSQYSLSDVKAKAQDLVQKVSRDAVKNTINKYADKISEVKESDYAALMADFEELEG